MRRSRPGIWACAMLALVLCAERPDLPGRMASPPPRGAATAAADHRRPAGSRGERGRRACRRAQCRSGRQIPPTLDSPTANPPRRRAPLPSATARAARPTGIGTLFGRPPVRQRNPRGGDDAGEPGRARRATDHSAADRRAAGNGRPAVRRATMPQGAAATIRSPSRYSASCPAPVAAAAACLAAVMAVVG